MILYIQPRLLQILCACCATNIDNFFRNLLYAREKRNFDFVESSISSQLFYELSLDRLVPEDNLYRKINQAIDFGFLYKATRHYYGKDGQLSIDPA